MGTKLIVILQNQMSNDSLSIMIGLIIGLVLVAIIILHRRRELNVNENTNTVSDVVFTAKAEENEPLDEKTIEENTQTEDVFESEIERLNAQKWDIDNNDIETIVVTKKGLISISDDNDVYLDDEFLFSLNDDVEDFFVTLDGEIFQSDTESCGWHHGEEEKPLWIDYVQLADSEMCHPDGEIESDDDEISLDGRILYSGEYDGFVCHPNFGAIVWNDNRVFINKHLNYEGYFDDIFPDPLGLIVKIGDDYFLIEKGIPTPDLMASMNEEDYERVVSNSEHDFVRNRILSVYSGKPIQLGFIGKVRISQSGPLFFPSDNNGKVYLRDKVIFETKEGAATNIVIDGNIVFAEVDYNCWFKDGVKFFETNESIVNYLSLKTPVQDGNDTTDVWPDGTIVEEKDSVLYKDGEVFFQAETSSWYMHPKGVVVSNFADELFLIEF